MTPGATLQPAGAWHEPAPGSAFRRGAPCDSCDKDPVAGGVYVKTFFPSGGEPRPGYEECSYCGNTFKADKHGPRQTGRIPYRPEAYLTECDLTEVGNGERFCAMFGHRVRHVHEWGWLVWDGRCWTRDTRGFMESFAKKVVAALQIAADGHPDEERRKELRKWAKSSATMKKLREMVAAARSEPSIDRHRDEFDTHDGLLNVRNGVVNLATGELLPHNPDLLFTNFADVDYKPDAVSPHWDLLVRGLAGDDVEVLGYLQRAAGYTITGSTAEQKLFFLHGAGANGKTTYVEVLAKLLGDLANPVGFDSLLNSRDGKMENTLAGLVGCRMAMATEAPEGRSFNEEALKGATGGDTLRARFMYKDGFKFAPKFKLWITGNNKPTVRGITQGTWRRFELVDAGPGVPEAKRIKDLKQKILRELPGVLAWCVRGSVEWHKQGLATPKKIRDAVETYRLENDVVGRWIEECCTVRPDLSMKAGEGLRAINEWLRAGHEPELTASMFGRRIGAWNSEQLKKHKNGDGYVVWLGIGLGRDLPPPGKQGTLDGAPTSPSSAKAPAGVAPTAAPHDRMTFLVDLVRRLTKASERGWARLQDLVAETYAYGWTEQDLEHDLRTLVQNNVLFTRGGAGTWAPVNP